MICKEISKCKNRYKCLTNNTLCHKPFVKRFDLIIPEGYTVHLKEPLTFKKVKMNGGTLILDADLTVTDILFCEVPPKYSSGTITITGA